MPLRKFLVLFTVYCLLITVFTIYSYSQLDLNLTLSSNSTYQTIQHQLTQLGYFNRPLSTVIFIFILALFTIHYSLFTTKHERWKISHKQLWTLIVGGSLILTLSYPAFAHDIFNYMFDARIVVKYWQNPWEKTPLDFPTDEWTRFMRWTHVTSVYPPGWIATTIPFYLLGMGKFTLTLLSFKFMGLLAFLGSSWLMFQLAGRRAWVLWSFNPMVLIESLSSVHNEIAMVFFTLLAFWVYRNRDKVRPWRTPGSDLTKREGSDLSGRSDPSRTLKRSDLAARSDLIRRTWSYLLLIWAGLIKYSSFLLLPFLNNPFLAALAAWVSAAIFIAIREVNPWYLLLPVAMSFATNHERLTKISILTSIVVMYRYYPCVAIFSC